MTRDLHMQYGCGFSAPSSWINFDASPTLRFERLPVLGQLYQKNKQRFPDNVRYGDIIVGLPIAPASCKGIYSSHILEHLSRSDCEVAVRNTLSYLAPGGIFRLVVPDLEALARDYLADGSPKAAHDFIESSGMGTRNRTRGLTGFIREFLGNSRHLWLWDEKALVELLRSTGYGAIRRCQFGDCEDLAFREVEDVSRFERAVALECRRPV